jgi:hypothetical protein
MQGLSGDTKFHGKGLENQETFDTLETRPKNYPANSQLFLENSIKRTNSAPRREKNIFEGVLRVFPRRNLQS